MGFPWRIELPRREQRGTQERQDAQWRFEEAAPTRVCGTRGLLEAGAVLTALLRSRVSWVCCFPVATMANRC